jgi:hypothetical protein
MVRSNSYLRSIATLLALCLTGLVAVVGAEVAVAATTSPAPAQVSKQKIQESINNPATKAQLNKQVQEYLAKQKAQKAASGTAAAPQSSAAGATGGQSLTELANQSRQEENTTSTNTTAVSASSSGASTSTILLTGGLVAIAVLGGIAFFIFRDARSVAPVSEGPLGGSARNSAAQMRKRRAKAKAARRQRKRNR